MNAQKKEKEVKNTGVDIGSIERIVRKVTYEVGTEINKPYGSLGGKQLQEGKGEVMAIYNKNKNKLDKYKN